MPAHREPFEKSINLTEDEMLQNMSDRYSYDTDGKHGQTVAVPDVSRQFDSTGSFCS